MSIRSSTDAATDTGNAVKWVLNTTMLPAEELRASKSLLLRSFPAMLW